MPNAKIAIIVLNWNTYQLTFRCLQQLARIDYHPYEIILVDNASQDGSGPRLAADFPQCRYVQNSTNLGFTGGNNQALAALQGQADYLMLLNSDTEVSPDFLAPLLARLEADPTLAAVQPLILEQGKRKRIWNAGGDFHAMFGLPLTRHKGRKPEQVQIAPFTDWITGCCILVRSTILEEIGPLDDAFFAYFEDVDWSLRMRAQGHRLGVVPESIIYHHAAGSAKQNHDRTEGSLPAFSHYLNIRNHLYLLRKHPGWINRPGAWAYQLLKWTGYTLYFLLRGRFRKLRMVWKGLVDGLRAQEPSTD
ncbi:MAG: glycosyltransferase family 2 protein [Lutibacter sp.]|nr:glycosyltransferase family 2 protein [Lutibacter sp.]